MTIALIGYAKLTLPYLVLYHSCNRKCDSLYKCCSVFLLHAFIDTRYKLVCMTNYMWKSILNRELNKKRLWKLLDLGQSLWHVQRREQVAAIWHIYVAHSSVELWYNHVLCFKADYVLPLFTGNSPNSSSKEQ